MDIIIRVFDAIKAQLESNNEIKTIDWYNEQYQNTEKDFPRNFKAVYIEVVDPVEFKEAGNKLQLATIRVRLHIVLFSLKDTPVDSLQFTQTVAGILNGKDLFTQMGEATVQLTTKLVRNRAAMPKRYKNQKVTNLEMICEAYDQSLMDTPEFVSNLGFVVNG